MLQLYEHCLLTDIELADAQNVDQLLWKNAFYQVIEKFRQLLKDPAGENAQEIRSKLLQILDEVRRVVPGGSCPESWGSIQQIVLGEAES